MLLVLSLYFGSIFYLVKKVIETRNKINGDTSDITLDDTSDIISDITSNELFTNKNLSIDVDKENVIYVPENKTFRDFLCVIPLQLLAYKIAVQRDINPDVPKNLAKVVTVE
jgi:glucosamine 6-phosphate synthetase-like amidotransferase/phosphosugar isomerase protein